jgi:hypothetical protein
VRAELAGAAAFAVAYAGAAVTFVTTLAREPTSKRCECIAIEAHAGAAHVRAWREIICHPGRPPTLGPLSKLEQAVPIPALPTFSCT